MARSVKVYSTAACPYCIKTKQYLKDNNIAFENIDVSTDQEKMKEMVDRSGQMGVPVLDIDGSFIVGFDKGAINKALGL
ncbi:MAG: glutaredoxin domain-containing protein [Candidatus Omnitrophota bacterium]